MKTEALTGRHWTIHPEDGQPARYCLACKTCAERSEPDEDRRFSEVWAREHCWQYPGHNRFCEEPTRCWTARWEAPMSHRMACWAGFLYALVLAATLIAVMVVRLIKTH